MVILDKYHDEDELEPSDDGHTDAPPSYETISTTQSDSGPAFPVDEKWSRRSASPSAAVSNTPRPASRLSQPNPSSWLSMLPFTSRTSKQVRQTVLTLIRDLVLNADSPNLLDSCANACRTYNLDLPALLQEPFIEHHSAIYWAIVNRRDALLQSLLVHAAPLPQSTMSEIRLACLVAANQHLFQSLRCQREPFTKQMTPLSTSPGADALVLGSMPADEVSIRETDGRQGAFVAEMRINLWQKRMRVSGRVSVEFIARGRIWSLTFFSPPPTTRTAVGTWQVALCLLEHSPATFIDSRLVIDRPLSSSNPTNTTQASDLISLSPPPDNPSTPIPGPPLPSSPAPSNKSKSKSKSKAPQTIEMRLKSHHRLAYLATNTFLVALDAAFSGRKEWNPPHVEQWMNDCGTTCTNAIVAPLDNGAGAELLYDNTPFIATDGTLHVRLEARLEKPDATECVIC